MIGLHLAMNCAAISKESCGAKHIISQGIPSAHDVLQALSVN
jgi:hypothetical protein